MSRFVYVVDDDPGIRCELADILEASGMNVFAFASGEDLIEVLDRLQPGCILLDLNMPGRGGLQTQADLVSRNACHQVIVLTGSGSINSAVAAIRQGASDFLEKPFAIAGLLAAIDEAFDRLDEQQEEQRLRQEARERLEKLSHREREVLALLVEGKPNKIIAYDLGLSVRTVEVYRANLMNKLKTKSLSDAVKLSLVVNNTITKAAA
jgi:two-component system, LuxR family, response regulator FixJ